MDSKTKYKILGVSVAIGLVVILYPFFQNGEDTPSAAALNNPPTFPEQTNQVTSLDKVTTAANVEPSAEPALPPVAETTTTDNPPIANVEVQESSVEAATTAEKEVKTSPDDTIQKVHSDNTPKAPVVPVEATPDKAKKANIKTAVKKEVKKVINAITQPQLLSYKSKVVQDPIADDGLFALKNAAYVVQVGSFNDKNNARKLVNQLRASGYSAFYQKVSTNVGENTRVFVGPEKKPESARLLASQLENSLHLRGIVISYKPLKL